MYNYVIAKSLTDEYWAVQIFKADEVIFCLDGFPAEIDAIAFARGYIRGLETAEGLL